MQYDDFVASKRLKFEPVGFDTPYQMNPMLSDWQADIVRWALRRGRAALFEDCGLGKSFQQIEWAQHVHMHTGGNVLILAPLAVSQQTIREAAKLGYTIHLCKTGDDVQYGINIANYERLHHFDVDDFSGLVLDESSILKAYGGATRHQITEFAESIHYRLACTATPAPNDLIELINHADFLGIMRGKEIIALFFTQDGNTTHNWRLKGHAKEDFWKWMATWSVALRKPSDLGYEDSGFVLPSCDVRQVTVDLTDPLDSGMLFVVKAVGLDEQRKARNASLGERVQAAADLANNSDEQWLIWCDLNSESEALAKAIPNAVEVTGSDSPEYKEKSMLDFSDGNVRVLVSKPSICGFGMNWQNCRNMIFVGLSHSYEAYYQAMRRIWRFGQKQNVNIYVITSNADDGIVQNIERKEKQAATIFEEIVKHMAVNSEIKQAHQEEMIYREDVVKGDDWTIYLGDSIKRIDEIKTDSVGLSVFSPPFPGMYAYTNSPHDIGNTTHIDEMIRHFSYLVGPEKLLRITKPGRMACIHLMQLTAMKSRDGYIGVKDYRGRVIQMMQDAGWVYAGEVTIDKNPQIQATRNKERGLLFKTLATDSSLMRMALADYLIYFRKPGDNPEPIQAGISQKYNEGGGWITEKEWIEWAAPVWYRQTKDYPGGIRETDVLNVVQARETDDERHLCPLQLGVIERAIKLWSAPGDLVFSPFTGVGSEGYQALKLNRKFVGCELKESYWKSAIANLKRAEQERSTMSLFDLMAAD
jgi:DNA modification methylase